MSETISRDGPAPSWPGDATRYITEMQAEALANPAPPQDDLPIIPRLYPIDPEGPLDDFALAIRAPKADALFVLRRGLLPVLDSVTLAKLRQALVEDDDRLQQGQACVPSPMLPQCRDWPVETACLLGFIALLEGKVTAGEVAGRYAELAVTLDAVICVPAAYRRLTDWFDDTRREVVRAVLLREIGTEIQAREALTKAG